MTIDFDSDKYNEYNELCLQIANQHWVIDKIIKLYPENYETTRFYKWNMKKLVELKARFEKVAKEVGL